MFIISTKKASPIVLTFCFLSELFSSYPNMRDDDLTEESSLENFPSVNGSSMFEITDTAYDELLPELNTNKRKKRKVHELENGEATSIDYQERNEKEKQTKKQKHSKKSPNIKTVQMKWTPQPTKLLKKLGSRPKIKSQT